VLTDTGGTIFDARKHVELMRVLMEMCTGVAFVLEWARLNAYWVHKEIEKQPLESISIIAVRKAILPHIDDSVANEGTLE